MKSITRLASGKSQETDTVTPLMVAVCQNNDE